MIIVTISGQKIGNFFFLQLIDHNILLKADRRILWRAILFKNGCLSLSNKSFTQGLTVFLIFIIFVKKYIFRKLKNRHFLTFFAYNFWFLHAIPLKLCINIAICGDSKCSKFHIFCAFRFRVSWLRVKACSCAPLRLISQKPFTQTSSNSRDFLIRALFMIPHQKFDAWLRYDRGLSSKSNMAAKIFQKVSCFCNFLRLFDREYTNFLF